MDYWWWFRLNCLLYVAFFTRSNLIRVFFLLRSSILAQKWIHPDIWQKCAYILSTYALHTYTRKNLQLKFKLPMFHFRHKTIVANILFGHTFSYFGRDLYDFCRKLWFLFYICSMIFPSFDNNNTKSSSNNKRHSFLMLQWEKNHFTCAIWNVTFRLLRFLPLTLQMHSPNWLVGKKNSIVLHLWFYKRCGVWTNSLFYIIWILHFCWDFSFIPTSIQAMPRYETLTKIYDNTKFHFDAREVCLLIKINKT